MKVKHIESGRVVNILENIKIPLPEGFIEVPFDYPLQNEKELKDERLKQVTGYPPGWHRQEHRDLNCLIKIREGKG